MLSSPKGVVVALGNFDGVHLGHRAVIRRAKEEARARSMRLLAATFDPHPQAIVGGRRRGDSLMVGNSLGPFLLTPLEVKKEELIRLGVDEVRVIRFDSDLARKSPRSFVLEVLVGVLGAAVVVVGENFRFGYKASGGFSDLDSCMREAGGEAIAVPTLKIPGDASTPHEKSGEIVSSTKIRALLASGEVHEASTLLGRPYSLRGRVVAGEGRGRTLGFPTANVVPIDTRSLVPGRGVYAGRVCVYPLEEEGESSNVREYGACTNVGLAPTFAKERASRQEILVEAHLLDYDLGPGALYGKVLDVTFVERIRAEKRFLRVEDLKEQIARDVHEARRVLRKDA